MFDKKQEKNKKHFDIYIDGKKFKIMNSFITETPDKRLRLVTKIRGQQFPREHVAEIIINTPNCKYSLQGLFCGATLSPVSEEWCYELI